MRHIFAISIALTVMVALTAASFHFSVPHIDMPAWAEQGPSRPVLGPSDGLSSIDYMKNTTRDPGQGKLSSNWYDFIARGQQDGYDRALYLGFNYTRDSTGAIPGELYYTGETSAGKRVYVSPADPRKSRVPDVIYLAGSGDTVRYVLADKPPIYAYTPYTAYNTNETVAFGLADDSGGDFELRNAAPYEIQRKTGDGWVTVFSPVAAQILVPMENGTFREWHWDQRLDDGSRAPFGDYRAVISGEYVTAFSLSADTPTVERADTNYGRESVEEAFVSPPQAGSFQAAYTPAPYSAQLREDVVSEMLFKAWAKKLDPGQLNAAINATGMRENPDMLPCLAVRASYEGRPAWILAFVYGGDEVVLSRIRYFVVGDDASVIVGGPISV